ncbi:MAG: hypothetical protein GY950_10600 [bacterium]|nr:hypothetical protein [bacterium]
MRTAFNSYSLQEEIPVRAYLKKRKLVKYFNRETAAAMVCLGQLLNGESLPPTTPFYYAKGLVEYEDIGLGKLVEASTGDSGGFSQEKFVLQGMSSISPLTQFKVLYNMPLSFVAIEHNLTGDNSVIYSSAAGLILQALHGPPDVPILLGADRVYKDGRVETGFALAEKEEIEKIPPLDPSGEAIDLFRRWHQGTAK